MHASENVILICLPGCGKSTFGKKLGVYSNRQFVDLDSYIEKQEKMSIPDIFSKYGEEGFRKAEEFHFGKLMRRRQSIISLGGGTLLNPGCRQNVKKMGFVIYLEAKLETIAKRILADVGTRPLFAEAKDEEAVLKKLQELHEIRHPIYLENSHATLNTEFSSPDAQLIDAFYRESRFYNKGYNRDLKLIDSWDWEREMKNYGRPKMRRGKGNTVTS